MPQPVDDERRSKPRVDFKTNIVLKMDRKNVRAFGSSRDLSLKGVYIKTKNNISVGTRCHVEIRLSGMNEKILLEMRGNVVRKEPSGIGVVFNSMDLETYTHLKNIVRYNYSNPDLIF